MNLAVKLESMKQAVQQLDPQISTDRIAARKIARDLKRAASQGEPNGWQLYRAFRKAAKLAGLLASEAHFQLGGA